MSNVDIVTIVIIKCLSEKYREAFSGFEPEIVSKFTDIKITTMSKSYGINVGFIRGVVDNSNSILEV